MAESLLWLIVVIVVADFAIERFVGYLNTTRWSDTIPLAARGIYDEKEYARQQAYQRENYRFGQMVAMVSFLLLLTLLMVEGFAHLDRFVADISEQPAVQAILFFAILGVAADLFNTPFALYATFRIEAKYGFNNTTVATFLADKLKGYLIAALLGGAVLWLVVSIYHAAGSWFWLLTWGVMALFSIFMAMFYSSLIVPLFNKQTPLEEGELKDAIQSFAATTGFKLDNIFVIDGSKRSTRANAYFTGLGAKKRIVLYDTLIADMSVDEVVAVLAHEIGHYKKRHVVQGLMLGLLQTGLLLFLFSIVAGNPSVGRALGSETPTFHIGLVAFSLLYSPFSMATGWFMNHLSRRNEYAADEYAAVHFGAQPLISALRKLSVKNLSNLTPHPVYVFFNYSHPPLLQRLDHLGQLVR